MTTGKGKFEVVVDGEEVLAAIRATQEGMTFDVLLERIGQFMLFKIKSRSQEGKDYQGNLFAEYSPKYKLFRIKKGRPVDKVNLTFYGTMWASMTTEIKTNSVRAYFLNTSDPNNDDVTNAQKAYFLNQKREFFKLSPEDIKLIENMVTEQLNPKKKKGKGKK
jgi:hypothetical protein